MSSTIKEIWVQYRGQANYTTPVTAPPVAPSYPDSDLRNRIDDWADQSGPAATELRATVCLRDASDPSSNVVVSTDPTYGPLLRAFVPGSDTGAGQLGRWSDDIDAYIYHPVLDENGGPSTYTAEWTKLNNGSISAINYNYKTAHLVAKLKNSEGSRMWKCWVRVIDEHDNDSMWQEISTGDYGIKVGHDRTENTTKYTSAPSLSLVAGSGTSTVNASLEFNSPLFWGTAHPSHVKLALALTDSTLWKYEPGTPKPIPGDILDAAGNPYEVNFNYDPPSYTATGEMETPGKITATKTFTGLSQGTEYKLFAAVRIKEPLSGTGLGDFLLPGYTDNGLLYFPGTGGWADGDPSPSGIVTESDTAAPTVSAATTTSPDDGSTGWIISGVTISD